MGTFYDIHRHDLIIPGLAGTFTLCHISDSHLCVVDDGTTADEAERLRAREAFWGPGKRGFCAFYGEPWCPEKEIPSWECFDRLMTLARVEGADAILSTGDLFEHMHGGGERLILRTKAALPMPFIAAPGNHESAACPGIWDEGITVTEFPGFRVVTLDDRLRTAAPAVLDRLEALCAERVPIILMMHIPLLTDLNRTSCALGRLDPYYTVNEANCDEGGHRLLSILRRTDAVRLILCGHVHGYTDSFPVEGIRQLTAPQAMTGGVNMVRVHG